MELNDRLKLKVATRLMDKSAATWWDNLKFRISNPITWELFVQEFNDQFYTQLHRDQKRQEFFRLSQLERTVAEYETELRELAEFVLEVINFEDYLFSKFEEGLNLEVREKMSVSGNQSYKKVVQLALRAEKLANERFNKGKFRRGRILDF